MTGSAKTPSKEIKGIEDLQTDPDNANKGTERGLAILEDSLQKYGAGRSIVVDKDGVVIAGNKTLESAVDLGLGMRLVKTDGTELVVVQREDLDLDGDEGRARELAYADNRSSQVGLDWDLGQIVEDVEAGVDLSGLWGVNELKELLKSVMNEPPEDPGPQIDRAEELREKWGTERGQIWEIGKHRLMCGDSTSEGDVGRLMGGNKVQLIVTSPPYWVGKEYEIQSSEEDITTFVKKSAIRMCGLVEESGRVVINCGTTAWSHIGGKIDYRLNLDWWQEALRKQGWLTRSIRIWSKHGGLVHTAPNADIVDMHWEFLGSFYCPAGQYRGQNRIGEGWATSGIWDGIHGAEQESHSAPYPTIIPERFISLYTVRDDAVADCFLGSGTTMVAAEQTGRICYGMEIEPKYVAVTLERMVGMGLEAQIIEE